MLKTFRDYSIRRKRMIIVPVMSSSVPLLAGQIGRHQATVTTGALPSGEGGT